MIPKSQKWAMGGFIAVLTIVMVLMQNNIDPQRKQFEPDINNVNSAVKQLPIEFALGAATGLREAIAGLLWVRTDEFFHEGDYDAIVPMVRIITWLDPHNLNVYQTGAWHLAYNFTDQKGRSDRRYLPYAISLMNEAIKNNPDESPLYADLAFTHLRGKVEDYPAAVKTLEDCQNLLRPKQPVEFDTMRVGHTLAHMYEATGQVDKAIAEWQLCVDDHKSHMQYWSNHPDPNANENIERSGFQTATKNLNEDILRKKYRAQLASLKPTDVGFSVVVTRTAPMVFDISGTANMIGSPDFVLETGKHTWAPTDGCRVEIRLQNADYKYVRDIPFGLSATLPTDTTILQDTVSVTNGKFHKTIDLAEDHGGKQPFYPLNAKNYTLTFWMNPSNNMDFPINVSDRVGWLGEGMTDKHYLDTSGVLPFTGGSKIPGLRQIIKVIPLTQDDVMGNGLKSWN